MNVRPLLTAALMATALTACGGGGGSPAPAPAPSPTPSPTPAPAVAPLVSQAPASRAVAVGASVTFNVTVVGSGPLTYQWLRNGSPIAGATGATYTTPVTTLADDGTRFAVTATGPGVQVTSSVATLTVFAPPAAAASCAGSDAFSVVGDTTLTVGKAGGLTLAGCTGALSAVNWTQTAGPAQPLLSARTQAVSFEPDTPGTYSFNVSFRDAGNVARNAPVDVTVSGTAPATRVLARADQAIREGGRGSVRAWPTVAAGDTLASLTWAQIEGPAVELDTSDPARVIFTAPAVTRDTVLRFRVTMRTTGNATDSDDVRVVVENLPNPPAGQLLTGNFKASRVYPYRASSPYAADLVRCVYDPALYYASFTDNNLCTLGTLPLLAQETGGAVPSVAQVMNRVLVSHDWMGARFEQFLQRQGSDDFLRLLGSVNAIVLGAHVRPSFYWSATGAIYLDADNLWLTPAERDVVSEVPDFRSGLDRDLNYTGLWRYVVANQPALLFFNPASRLTRDLGYLDYDLGSLMYHELAHANDFFPPASRTSAPTNVLVFQASPSQLPSDRLAQSLPLASQQMFGLARVKFYGEAANDTQKAWTPREVADFFRVDRATDEYSYSIPPGSSEPSREDLAMLFEEFMMAHRYGVRRDVAMTNKFRPGMSGSDLFVAWGQRGRIGEASIKPRVTQVLSEIAPWISASDVNALAAPLPLREGASWTANLNPATAGTVRSLSTRQQTLSDDPRAIERLLQMREQRRFAPPELR